MAWTVPRDWTTGEIVTETMMDTHVRDNLNYLKGATGAISLDGDVTVNDAASALFALNHTSGVFKSYHGISSAGAAAWNINRNPDSGAFDDTAKSHASMTMDGSGTSSFIAWRTAAAANTFGTERMRLNGAGFLGIGRTVPQGVLHTYDSISGLLKYEFDGLDGTARTLIPDGAGDVLYSVSFWALIRSSGGTVVHVLPTNVAPGANVNMYSSGADIVQFQVAANGAVTVQRTGGALTYKVSLLLHWL